MHMDQLVVFIVEAKKQTYAAQGDDASVAPLLRGSKQLEYRSGSYSYRDIYFGTSFFAGQESVEHLGIPSWSMVYSGGMLVTDVPGDQIKHSYSFLREALRTIDARSPYRGPRYYSSGANVYRNDFEGDIANFHGHETIEIDGVAVYKLQYSGGLIRS